MTKNLFSITIILAATLLYPEDIHAHTLLCKDWMGGTYAGQREAFETDANINKNQLRRETASDSAGTKAQCFDFFPTWGERMKLERLNSDPFETKYLISRQYCWARFVFSGDKQCGAPRITKWCFIIPCEFSWDPPEYECWGDTREKTVTNFNSGDEFTMVSGFNIVKLYKVRPMGAFGDRSKNTGKTTKICAYYKTNFLGGWFTDNNSLIGCVDEPLKPVPPTFNFVMPSIDEPYVDQKTPISTLIAKGSRFDQPLAIIKFGDPPIELFLRYKFDGDNFTYNPANLANAQAKVCDKFNNYPATYCAKIPHNRTQEVCVCEKENCDEDIFIGCLPRPIPADSKSAIVGTYVTKVNEIGEMHPAISIIAAHTNSNGEPIILDSEGSEVYQKNGNNYKLDSLGNQTNIPAVDPLQYKKLPLPLSPIIIREYVKQQMQDGQSGQIQNIVTRDSASLYGLNFNAIISKIDPSTGELKQLHIRTPQMRWSKDGCVVTTSESSGYSTFYTVTGKRFRDNCCPSSIIDVGTQIQQCIVPRYLPKCLGSPTSTPPYVDKGKDAPPQNIEAEKAVCPGAYEGPLLNPDGSLVDPSNPDRICIVNDSSWNEAMPKPYCVEMPRPCEEVKIPTSNSGYAIWPKTDQDITQQGICKEEFGFEYARNIEIRLENSNMNLTSDTRIELDKAKNELSLLQQNAKKENRNIQLSEFSMSYGIKNALELDSIKKNGVIISKTGKLTPTRKCTTNVYATTVQNPCVKTSRCKSITEAAPANGNLNVPDASEEYKSNLDTSSGPGNVDKPISNQSTINGQCISPYQNQGASTPTKRACITDYYMIGSEPYILKQIWGDEIENRCSEPPQNP